ncbi:hypothetical protein NDU88_002924 [Pleurodeles waltl]|uniref:Transmembrane protein n=1 Tax=Pleurodeles waltl TaxID=8319 RepID=A0AAV7VDW0_PLEWA|nr:hypothetical protein NDU88_002924 [Pleurodeles waltl]
MVCASVSPLHTRTCVVIFHLGKTCVVFRHVDRLPLWIAGLPDVPGSVRGFLGLLSVCASFRGAVRRIFFLTASVVLISYLEVRRRCRGEAMRPGSGRTAGVASSAVFLDWRAVNFSLWSKLSIKFFGAQGVQLKKRSLFGPETSGNRRQALSKPLESAFAARQEFSKAAGQQQGSSPL